MSVWRSGLERKREGVVVAGVNEDSVLENIPADETLNMLPVQGRSNGDGLDYYVVPWHDKPDEVLMTRHAGRGRRVYICTRRQAVDLTARQDRC